MLGERNIIATISDCISDTIPSRFPFFPPRRPNHHLSSGLLQYSLSISLAVTMTLITTITKFLSLSTGENVFYREAGLITSPTILLLHGYPTSSHQYRNLIPILSPHYRVIAPDLPGFGFTSTPDSYIHTFDALASTISTLLTELPTPPAKYSIYIFDYGAPVGFRLALQHPERIQAIISQNGNAYLEGLGTWWNPVKELWASNNSVSARDALRPSLELVGTKSQYFDGEPDRSSIAPESYSLDQYLLDQPGNKDIQLDLFYDYRTNLEMYGEWQAWMRESRVPLLAVWGGNDVIFVKEGAEAYKSDLPDAEVNLLDAGHFAVESHARDIGALMLEFLGRKGI
jgi:pimeloyl-ACP methyl ester carboxylesterase